MQYRQLGRTDLNVSVLCLGTMTMGWSSDRRASFALMDAAVEAGINFFDTADIYSKWVAGNPGGVAETFIGEWLQARGARDKIILATKVRGRMWTGPEGEGLSRAHIMRAVEDSLRRLQVEVIDLYQTHWPDDDAPYEETMRALGDLVQQGKVRHLGCSNHDPQQLRTALATSLHHGLARYESLQPHYNLVHRQEFEAGLMQLCRAEEIGVIPYSPLARGFLTGKYKRGQPAPGDSRGAANDSVLKYTTDAGYAVVETLTAIARRHNATPAQMAIAWLLANSVVTSAIIGARTVAQLRETINSVEITLSDEELDQLNHVTDKLKTQD